MIGLLRLILLTAVALHCGLALVDHHAADYEPWHDHVVLRVDGARAVREVARPHEHNPVVGRAIHHHHSTNISTKETGADYSHVVSIPDHTHSSGMSLFGVAMDYLFALDQAQPVETPSSTAKSLTSTFLAPAEITLPPPEPPPRSPAIAIASF